MNPDQDKSTNNKSENFENTGKQQVMAMVLLVIFSTTFGFAGGYFGDHASKNNSQDQQAQRQTINNEGELTSKIA